MDDLVSKKHTSDFGGTDSISRQTLVKFRVLRSIAPLLCRLGGMVFIPKIGECMVEDTEATG